MSPARLLEHFDRLIDTPDAIPRLRRFILDLAVRGKLVEQDPKDEPAGELLKRIEKQRRRLVKDGKIKVPKDLPTVEQAERSYDIPIGWHWTRLGASVNSHSGGGTPSKNNSTYWDGDIHWASVKDIGKTKYVDDTIDRITEAGLASSSSNLIPPGNLIVVTRMGLGKISINRIPVAINQDLRALSLSKLADIDFYYIFFKTASYEGSGLTVKGIKVEELLNFPFPLPPLAEQHRIVAKVDELMALCDELESAQTKREKRRDRLVAATLHGLNAGNATPTPSSPSTFEESALFYFNLLPRLTTRPEHIHQLRQTILNFAVRGMLVPQEHTGTTTADTLSLVQAEESRLTTGSRLRKDKLLAEIPDDQLPFPIPGEWEWVRVGSLSRLVEYGTSVKSNSQETGIPVLRMGDIQDGRVSLVVRKKVPWSIPDLPRLFLKYKDILYNRTNSAELVGKTGLFLGEDDTYTFASYLIRIRVLEAIADPVYVNLAMNSPYFRETQILPRLQQQCGQANVNGTKLRHMLIPLPPILEQHRIVKKVDELVALCDKLETGLISDTAKGEKFLEASLAEALKIEPAMAS